MVKNQSNNFSQSENIMSHIEQYTEFDLFLLELLNHKYEMPHLRHIRKSNLGSTVFDTRKPLIPTPFSQFMFNKHNFNTIACHLYGAKLYIGCVSIKKSVTRMVCNFIYTSFLMITQLNTSLQTAPYKTKQHKNENIF